VEESDIKAPLYYVIGKDVKAETAQYVFTITPCFYGVVSKHADVAVVQPYVTEVLKAEDETACREIASHVARSYGSPVLLVGEGNQITAVYSTGEEETLCLSNLT
jgi:hypothetical protein